jgi:hypothetical protein
MMRPIYRLMIGPIAASTLLGRAAWAHEEAAQEAAIESEGEAALLLAPETAAAAPAIDAYDPADWTESAS